MSNQSTFSSLTSRLTRARHAAAIAHTLTDDSGVEVTFPAAPQRIVTLHDSQLTIPLIELGILPAGSHGRVSDAGTDPFIRSGMILTGTDFSNSSIQWVGDYPADIELIAAAAPDLIITTEWNEVPAEQLRQIAPTVVIDTAARSRDAIYDFLAEIAGGNAQEQLARLRARYEAQIAQIKLVIEDPASITVSNFQVYNGNISSMHTYGNLGRVLRDAGFTFPEIIDAMGEGGESSFSLESLPEFDADVIFATYNTGWGNGLPAERENYETSIPGFCDQMFACRTGQMFFIPRDEAFSMSYDALGMTAYAILALLGGQDIETRSE
jgi:iron complex transport system substrate-binding protein